MTNLLKSPSARPSKMNQHSDTINPMANVFWDSTLGQDALQYASFHSSTGLRAPASSFADDYRVDSEVTYPDDDSALNARGQYWGMTNAAKGTESLPLMSTISNLSSTDATHLQDGQQPTAGCKDPGDREELGCHRVVIRPISPIVNQFEDFDSDDDDDIEIIDGNTVAIAGIKSFPMTVTSNAAPKSDSEEEENLFDDLGKTLFGSEGYTTDESEGSEDDGEHGEKLVDEIVDELLKACRGRRSEDEEPANENSDDEDSNEEERTIPEKDPHHIETASEQESTDDDDDETSGDDDASESLGDEDSETDDSDAEKEIAVGVVDKTFDTDDESSSEERGADFEYLELRRTAMLNRRPKRQMYPDDLEYEESREMKRLKGDNPNLNTPVSKAEDYIQAVTPLGYGKVIQTHNYLSDELPGIVPRDEYRSILLRMNRTMPKRFA